MGETGLKEHLRAGAIAVASVVLTLPARANLVLPARLRGERGDGSTPFFWIGGAFIAAAVVAGIAAVGPSAIGSAVSKIISSFGANTPASP